MAEDLMPQALVDTLLPGLGFFGGTENFALKLDVDKELNRIIIEIDAGKPEILNISTIRFYGIDGKEINRRSVVKSISLSSIYEDYTLEEVTSRVLDGKLIHTHREPRPYLSIDLSSTIFISKIVIYNRNDFYGCRSRYIIVKGLYDESCEFCYANVELNKNYNELSKIISELDFNRNDLERAVASGDLGKVQSHILQKLRSKPCNLSIRQICYFLPVYQEIVFNTSFNTSIIAHILLRILESSEYADTNILEPFNKILSRDIDIDNLSLRLNELSSSSSYNICSSGNYIISKHLVQRNILLNDRDKYISALKTVIGELQNLGVESVVCYGTLLGAVREGGFLAHDDDVDILYIDESKNLEESRKKNKILISKLRDSGYSVNGETDNFHVSVDGVSVDVFPCWINEDKATLLMEYFRYRDISASILVPPSSVEIYGRTFPAPADPEGFLRERYGEGWSISDPYHEWPWKVERSTIAP